MSDPLITHYYGHVSIDYDMPKGSIGLVNALPCSALKDRKNHAIFLDRVFRVDFESSDREGLGSELSHLFMNHSDVMEILSDTRDSTFEITGKMEVFPKGDTLSVTIDKILVVSEKYFPTLKGYKMLKLKAFLHRDSLEQLFPGAVKEEQEFCLKGRYAIHEVGPIPEDFPVIGIEPGTLVVHSDSLSRMLTSRSGMNTTLIHIHPGMTDITPELETSVEKVEGVAAVTKERPSSLPFSEFAARRGLIGIPHDIDLLMTPIVASRGPMKEIIEARGLSPERGILLSGPPGTGKTSMTRLIAEYLECPESHLTIASGPELLNRYVGETEEAIRQLFASARHAYNRYGDQAPLYIIAVDEIDILVRRREELSHSFETGKITQLLAELDGMHAVSNVLFIGITNIPENIDSAFLRPGRLGVHIHMRLPNLSDRVKILTHYLDPLVKLEAIDPSVDMGALGALTKGYSGADLRGLVERVNRLGMSRIIAEGSIEETAVGNITMKDFVTAIASQAGIRLDLEGSVDCSSPFSEYLKSQGFIGAPKGLDEALLPILAPYGSFAEFAKERGIEAEKGILFAGPPGTGKTTVARHLAGYLGCPEEHVRMVSTPELINGFGGGTEANLRELFAPAIRAASLLGENSPPFVIIFDEIDALAINRAYNPLMAPAVNQLLTLIDGLKSSGNILVIGTTNREELIDPALRRSGRMGTTLTFDTPKTSEIAEMFEVFLKPMREREELQKGLTGQHLASICPEGFNGADVRGIIESAKRIMLERILREGKEVDEMLKSGRVALSIDDMILPKNTEVKSGEDESAIAPIEIEDRTCLLLEDFAGAFRMKIKNRL